MMTTFSPSLSYSKYLDTLCVIQKASIKTRLIVIKVQVEFSKKFENVLNNVTHNIAQIMMIKYTDIMILLTLALFVRILQ